jgi:vacuolar-type H+-ATPase subunit H
MAGEVIEKIKGSEEDALRLLDKAKADARKLIEATARKKEELIANKKETLKDDEARITQTYARETEQAVGEISDEETKDIESVDRLCEGNVRKVVSYIIEEIVRE